MGVRYGEPGVPLVIAHRCGAGLGPENTLAAAERSVALGLRYLETDARTTADGVVVAFHDRSVRRLTGARADVARLTWAQVQALRVAGEPVARLEDLLAAWPQVCWAIDVKDPVALPELARVLARTGATSRVCLTGTRDRWLVAARDRLGPPLRTALGWESLVRLLVGGSFQVPVHEPSFAHVPFAVADRVGAPRLAERVARAGLRSVVWGVPDAAAMHRLLDAGIDALISDHADVLREVLVARGQWAAARTGGRTGGRTGALPVVSGWLPGRDPAGRAGAGAGRRTLPARRA